MLGSPVAAVESPKAEWTAASGGVRHGAARSVAAGRRKSAIPIRARPQVPPLPCILFSSFLLSPGCLG